jgi:hypothetical protein
MISIALGLFIVAIVYIAIWSIKNDGVRSIEDQSGFIRMRVPTKAKPTKGRGPVVKVPAAKGRVSPTD